MNTHWNPMSTTALDTMKGEPTGKLGLWFRPKGSRDWGLRATVQYDPGRLGARAGAMRELEAVQDRWNRRGPCRMGSDGEWRIDNA